MDGWNSCTALILSIRSDRARSRMIDVWSLDGFCWRLQGYAAGS
jgi:hypothetical protein